MVYTVLTTDARGLGAGQGMQRELRRQVGRRTEHEGEGERSIGRSSRILSSNIWAYGGDIGQSEGHRTKSTRVLWGQVMGDEDVAILE